MSFIPYQVDYAVASTGRTLGVTKKKVIFKFGIANAQALSEGLSGPHCRGTEHEIVFTWSLKSGKRHITADNRDVHRSESGQNGWTADRTFQHQFTIPSPNNGMVRCHLVTSPPNHDAPGGNRPFDLRVNQVSYFDMCKIFQLGTPAMIVRPVPAMPTNEDYMSREERQMVARAKLNSLRDMRSASQPPPPAPAPAANQTAYQQGGGNENSLIKFDEVETAPPRNQSQRYMSSVTLDPALLGRTASTDTGSLPSGYGGSPPAYNNYSLPPSAVPAQIGQPPPPVYGQPPQYPQGQAYQQPPPYQQPPAQQAPSLAGAPAWQSQSIQAAPSLSGAPTWQSQSFHAAPPPTLEEANKAFAPQPIATNYAGAPSFASPQSAASYGSAPSFAQPPSQNQNYRGY